MINVKRDMLVSIPQFKTLGGNWRIELKDGDVLNVNKFRLVVCPDVLFYFDSDGTVSAYKSTLRKYDEKAVWDYFFHELGFENSLPLVYNETKNRMETSAFKHAWF